MDSMLSHTTGEKKKKSVDNSVITTATAQKNSHVFMKF